MAYTIGTSHGPFSGAGNFTIAKPAGIRTVATGISIFTGHDGATPRRYFRLGRFTLGNTDGFSRSWGLEYAQQLVYPLPPVWELLSYDIKDGASCLFQELVEAADLTQKQPWDRAPLPIRLTGATDPTAGGSTTTIWTYTVPTGRRLFVERSSIRIFHYTAPTTVGAVYGNILLDAVNVLTCELRIGTVGVQEHENQGAGPLLLNAGQVLSSTALNQDTGGGARVQIAASGFIFDA